MYRSSNTIDPLIVGIPDSLPPTRTPACTPRRTREGWKSVEGNSPDQSGGPKQNTSVLAIGRAPRPVPRMSRFTPTMPVMAPPYGSRAEGELWVSAFIQIDQSSFQAITPELSWKTESSQSTSFAISWVGFMMWVLNSESTIVSSFVSVSIWCILLAKILCLQCSLHVCAKHSSSTSVGASGEIPTDFRASRVASSR